MLKKYFAILLLSAGVTAGAADLLTESGRKYTNVEIRKIASGCVQIIADQGEATIALDELPESFIAALSIRQRYALQSLTDIVLKDGTVYRKTSINSLGSGFVFISHLDGNAKIAYKDLPEKYLSTFTRKQLEAVKQTPKKNKSLQTAAAPNTTQVNKNSAAVPQNVSQINGTPSGEVTKDGKIIYIGPKGGRFYINSNGKKVYIKQK